MKYLHTMVRVSDLEQALDFYVNKLGLVVKSRREYPQGRYTLAFLSAPGDDQALLELTHNWDPEELKREWCAPRWVRQSKTDRDVMASLRAKLAALGT